MKFLDNLISAFREGMASASHISEPEQYYDQFQLVDMETAIYG